MQLPKNMLKNIPRDYFDSAKGTLKLLWEAEWRGLGITQVFYIRIISLFPSLTSWYRVLGGSTMKFMNQSLTFYSLSGFESFRVLRSYSH